MRRWPIRGLSPGREWRSVGATRIGEEDRARTGERGKPELPWNVILHNDLNPINRVVWRLWRTLPGMTFSRATRITWRAHCTGRAVAKSCHKELAELYEERLRARGLTVSVEPA